MSMTDIRFQAGRAYSRRHKKRPPNAPNMEFLEAVDDLVVDLHCERDRYTCPIYMVVDGRVEDFVIDVGHPSYALSDEARHVVQMRADLIAEALTIAVENPEWRKRNLRFIREDRLVDEDGGAH